ncbi:PREDICTED: acyl-coenzyme A thioesterase 11-like [Cyprinodon variegatus]|uniref:acyl-coenzyme A thioesterase 11-like n=1 Tax=Cyprinodon variegatus TaxID=28743 RepID=UPI000742C1A5|nr:PREDICTED: acyl-coenzyme A thioesterase 11-like [Cyprinodon variegatus]
MISRLSDRTEEEEEEEEDEEHCINPTEVKMSQIVMPFHCNHRQELSVGQLLKWMDSTACLSAERHAGSLCVTASMDDIHFEHTISVGQVVNIGAKVNRAFNSSMERVVPKGQPKGRPPFETPIPKGRTCFVLIDCFQMNTFGGQIMAWMVNVATIAASRFCQAHPTLRTIDMFNFRGPSQVGDRLQLKAIVNNAYKNSLEVGVRAEAYLEEGLSRHINSAFMIFEVLDSSGKPCALLRIRPEPLEGERRYQEAVARKKIRLDRKYIVSRKQNEVPLSVPWDPRNQVYLSYNNVSALKMLAARKNWRLSTERDKVRLYTLEQKSMLSIRVEAEVDVPANRAFCLLAELSNRTSWDTHYKKCELIHRVDDDDFIYRVVTPSVGSQTSSNPGETVQQDFILLASKRKPCGDGDPYVIALRSVSLVSHPPLEGYNRGEVLCAGFTILETSNNMSLISYYNQASPEVLPYISTDIAGLSSSFYHTFCSCSRYLSRNRQEPEELTGEYEATETNGATSPLSEALRNTQL